MSEGSDYQDPDDVLDYGDGDTDMDDQQPAAGLGAPSSYSPHYRGAESDSPSYHSDSGESSSDHSGSGEPSNSGTDGSEQQTGEENSSHHTGSEPPQQQDAPRDLREWLDALRANGATQAPPPMLQSQAGTSMAAEAAGAPFQVGAGTAAAAAAAAPTFDFQREFHGQFNHIATPQLVNMALINPHSLSDGELAIREAHLQQQRQLLQTAEETLAFERRARQAAGRPASYAAAVTNPRLNDTQLAVDQLLNPTAKVLRCEPRSVVAHVRGAGLVDACHSDRELVA